MYYKKIWKSCEIWNYFETENFYVFEKCQISLEKKYIYILLILEVLYIKHINNNNILINLFFIFILSFYLFWQNTFTMQIFYKFYFQKNLNFFQSLKSLIVFLLRHFSFYFCFLILNLIQIYFDFNFNKYHNIHFLSIKKR